MDVKNCRFSDDDIRGLFLYFGLKCVENCQNVKYLILIMFKPRSMKASTSKYILMVTSSNLIQLVAKDMLIIVCEWRPFWILLEMMVP